MQAITRVLADNIRRLRAQKKWTQFDLAEAMGTSVGIVRKYEGELAWPGTDKIKLLAKALGVMEADLFKAPTHTTIDELTNIIKRQEQRIAELESQESPPLKEDYHPATREIIRICQKLPHDNLVLLLGTVRAIGDAVLGKDQNQNNPALKKRA